MKQLELTDNSNFWVSQLIVHTCALGIILCGKEINLWGVWLALDDSQVPKALGSHLRDYVVRRSQGNGEGNLRHDEGRHTIRVKLNLFYVLTLKA